MKAQAFLELVGEMMTAQQDYYHLKRFGDKQAATIALIKSKDLEKRVRAVVTEGRLEPSLLAFSAEEFQEKMKLENRR